MSSLPPSAQERDLPEDWIIVAPGAGQTLYRVVAGDPLTLRDFMSNRDKGEPQRVKAHETAIQYLGLSLWASEEQARSIARKFPKVGRALAAVEITSRMSVARTRRTVGHYSAWAAPEAFLEAARLVDAS